MNRSIAIPLGIAVGYLAGMLDTLTNTLWGWLLTMGAIAAVSWIMYPIIKAWERRRHP